MWDVAADPTEPLSTATVGNVAATPAAIRPLIGPRTSPLTLVLRPTSTTFIYSSSILRRSLGWIEEIPLILKVEMPVGIPPVK